MQRDIVPPNSASNAFASVAVQNGQSDGKDAAVCGSALRLSVHGLNETTKLKSTYIIYTQFVAKPPNLKTTNILAIW